MDIELGKRITSKSVTKALLIIIMLTWTAMAVATSVNQPGSVHGQEETMPMVVKHNMYTTTPAEVSTSFQSQQSKVPEELTIDNIRQSRLVLLGGIDNAIMRLSESQPESIVAFNTSHIAELLQTDQLGAPIVELLEIRTQVIEVFGEAASNREVVPQIENLIGALEQQK